MRAYRSDRRVFVDTSAYYAVIDRRDADHRGAVATMHRLTSERRPLITTNIILFELHSLLLNRISRHIAWVSHQELRAAQDVVQIRIRDEARAEETLAQYDDKNFTLIDASSFAVMERFGISVAFSLDRHFAQYGWEIVPLDAS